MSEATKYLIKNINKTFEIYNAISKMEREVLSNFDKHIRESFPNWVSGDWICPKEKSLHEDQCINIIRKEWSYQDEKKETKSYIWTYLELDGDDPIWKFFGLPDEEGENSVCICLWLSDEFKQLSNYQQLIEEFDQKNQRLLTENGFNKRGGRVNRSYEMEVLFSNEAILNGLQNDNWDEAEKILIQAWKVFERVEWNFLKKAIQKHQKNRTNKFSGRKRLCR